MVATIFIEGSASSNNELHKALGNDGIIESKVMFGYNFLVTYKTRVQARKALSTAYRSLYPGKTRSERRKAGAMYSRGLSLRLDASVAKIIY